MSDGFGIRQSNNRDSQYPTATENSSDTRIGTALATANTGSVSSIVDTENEAEKIKKHRLEILNTTIKQYKLKKEEVLEFIKSVYGYNEERLYTLNNSEFNAIGNLIEAVAEFMVKNSNAKKNGKNINTKEAFQESAKEIKKLLDNGYTTEQATNFINNFENLKILDILKIHHPELKNYQSLKDIPQDIIEQIVKKFLDNFATHDGTKDNMDIGESYQIFSSLMNRCTTEEAGIFMNAFLAIAEKDDKYKGLVHSIKMLKDKPETLEALLNDQNLNKIFTDLGLKKEEIKGFLEELFKTGLNPKTIAEKIGNYIEPLTTKYNELKNKKDLSDNDKKFIEMYENIQQGNIFTAVEYLLQRIKDIGEKQGTRLVNCANNGGFYEELMTNLATYFNEHPDDTSKELLNKITDNNYSEYELKAENTDKQSFSEADNTDKFGLTQRFSYEQIALLSNSVSQKQSDLLITTEDNEFSLIKDEPAVTDPNQSYNNFKNLTVNEIRTGLSRQKIKISDVLHQYKNLSQSGKDFIEGLIKTMPKNSQYYYLKCIPSNIAIVALIKHTKINPEGFDIESSLDYASRKEVERIQEEKENNKAIK